MTTRYAGDATPLRAGRFLVLVLAATSLAFGCTGAIGDGNGSGSSPRDGGADNGEDGSDPDTEISVSPDLDEDQFMVDEDPGTRTLQRLNNTEYSNTMRDLLGIDSRPGDEFPTDDRGYGFDNIADVLSISPLHIELYERAAEDLLGQVLYVNDAMPEFRYFPADSPDVTASVGGAGGGGWNLWSNGTLTTVLNIEDGGRFRLSARAFGSQAGNETVRMAFMVDGVQVQTVAVPATSFETYETEVQIEAGVREVGVAFLNDFYDPDAGLDRNLIVEGFNVDGPLDVMPADNPLRNRIMVCDFAADNAGCGREIISTFGQRAWRRPLTQTEIDRLFEFVPLAQSEGDDPEVGLQLALQAILLSPHFVFKVELDADPTSREVHALDNYELATRLSYFLWRSMPDDELLDLAAAGQLQDRVVLAAQVQRMMDDPRAESLIDDYAGQWLYIRAIDEAVPDVWYYPDWNEGLARDMQTEAEMTFRTLYMDEDQSMLGLLNGRETFINDTLAAHYGIPGVSGSEFQRVDLTGTARVGWLTQGSLLTSTSYATRTSPVRRGQWVMEHLLCREPPPPPAGVEGIPAENPEGLSLRDRLELHRADPICASCHVEMDAIGFAFENFDGIGAWRTEDEGWAIDAASELPDGRTIDGAIQLGDALAEDPAFAHCAVEKTMTYAIGRGTEASDLPYIDRVVDEFVGSDHRLSVLLTEIVTSEPFRLRRGGE